MLSKHSKIDIFLNVECVEYNGDNMTGWNPRDPNIKKETIDIVNEFWWDVAFSRNTKVNHALDAMARNIIYSRRTEEESDKKIKMLYGLLNKIGIFPLELSNKVALGNERETFEAFNEYVRYIMDTANKRLDIFNNENNK